MTANEGPLVPWAQCPARGSGHAHVRNFDTYADGRCVYCQCPWDKERERWAELGKRDKIAPELSREYAQARQEGLGDQDAQALVAHLHGLGPGDDQKKPWTLEELNSLMVVKKTHDLLG